MALPNGKHMYIWILTECAGGDMIRLADEAEKAGFAGVNIKVTAGTGKFVGSRYDKRQQELLRMLVPLLLDKGIEVHFWGYVYGRDFYRRPQGKMEARVIGNMLREYDGQISSFTVNAEKEFKDLLQIPSKRKGAYWAEILMDALRDEVDKLSWTVPLLLSSYRYKKNSHPEFPFETFAEYIDAWAPQNYWLGSKRPDIQLRRSYKEMMEIKQLPYYPTGLAFKEHGHKPAVREINLFNATAKEMGLPGVSWWSWQHTEQEVVWWEAITNHDWPVVGKDPEQPGGVDLPDDLPVDVAIQELTEAKENINQIIDDRINDLKAIG